MFFAIASYSEFDSRQVLDFLLFELGGGVKHDAFSCAEQTVHIYFGEGKWTYLASIVLVHHK